jgi:hypothetical protein
MKLLKLAHWYTELAAGATLILQHLIVQSLPGETGFINFKGWYPSKKIVST